MPNLILRLLGKRSGDTAGVDDQYEDEHGNRHHGVIEAIEAFFKRRGIRSGKGTVTIKADE